MTKSSERSRRLGKNRGGDVKQRLAHLETAAIRELRETWVQVFSVEPHKSFGPALLRQSIAYKIQENAFGSLSRPAQTQINRLVKIVLAEPDENIEMPRRIKAGSELVRVWNDKTYKVVVRDDGFAYAGKTYLSLSEIANLITGTRWNGPRFFGLRAKTMRIVSNGK